MFVKKRKKASRKDNSGTGEHKEYNVSNMTLVRGKGGKNVQYAPYGREIYRILSTETTNSERETTVSRSITPEGVKGLVRRNGTKAEERLKPSLTRLNQGHYNRERKRER